MKTLSITLTIILAASPLHAGNFGRTGKGQGHGHQYTYHYGNGHYGNGHYGNGHYGNGHNYGNGYYGHNYNGHRNYGHYGRGYYGHASTYSEGLLRGAAAVIRAQGQFNRNTAEAAILIGEAQKIALDVEVKKVETRYIKRDINRNARPTKSLEEQAARRQRIANSSRPDRLGPTEYRADLGLLNWPAMLRLPHFAPFRGEVDTLVAAGPTALSQHSMQIRTVTTQMQESMSELIRDVPAHDYAAARRFLVSLQYETQLAGRGLAVASN